jgi:predicted secreted protein
MAKVDGTAIRFYVNTGTFGTPVYTVIDCETTSTLTVTRETKDVTGKCSGAWTELLGSGKGSFEITGSAHYENADPGIERQIADILTNNTMVKFQYKTMNSKVFSGTGQLSTFGITADHGSVIDTDFTLMGSGTLTYA